ncbi:MAG: hypothetical protein IPH56_08830 [Chitinophagaceae bacterium]|nr:hypothetical protein [Chitinophagaceae bacterium]
MKNIDSEPFASVFYRDGRSATLQVEEYVGKGVFNFPKNIEVLQDLIGLTTNDNDTILDFFGGSGSTAHAVIDMNKESGYRKFIIVQLPEICEDSSKAFEAGYKTIADISKDRIRKVIKKIEKEKAENPDMFDNGKQDFGFKVFKLTSSNFKIWRGNEVNEDNLVQQLEAFTDPVHADSSLQNMLYELILKAGYQLTDKVEETANYYSIAEGQLIIALKKLDKEIVAKIIAANPKKVITLDNLFVGNDQLKTNTVLQMKDAEIDFKTI